MNSQKEKTCFIIIMNDILILVVDPNRKFWLLWAASWIWGSFVRLEHLDILCSEKRKREQSGEVDINFHFYGIKTEQRKIRDMG